MSFSALLFASSGILSQPTDKIKSLTAYASTNNKISAPPPVAAHTATATDTSKNSTPIKTSEKLLALVKVNTTKPNSGESTSVRSVETRNAIDIFIDPNELQIAVSDTAVSKNFSDAEIAHLRQLFLQAEIALKKKDDAAYFLLSEQLKEYPLYPYLQYQWLRKNLNLETQVKHFLQQHQASRYARKLKYKWLHYLGKRKQWSLLLENQMITSDVTLNCYHNRAQIQAGDEQAALLAAQKLWAVGRSQPSTCDPLFSKLKKSKYFTQDLRWQRFDAALKNNRTSLASYVKDLMPAKYQVIAQLWLNLHGDPEKHLPQLLKRPQTDQSARMLTHAINRLASRDINKAIEIWDANKQTYISDKSTETMSATDSFSIAKLERRLALKLVFEGEAGAYERLGRLNKQNNSSRTWRVRVALTDQNWPNVLTAIHALEPGEKSQEKWQYWLARAYMETDNIEMAQALMTDLSSKRSFYGYLAADKVNGLYQLSANPVDVTADEIAALKNQSEFRVAFEFMVLDRKNEAKLQWWHATRQLNTQEYIIAAKLAQQWQWHEIAIFTVAKAKHWDDIELRFPISYADTIHKNSIQLKLNPAILFGLIRRESAFNEKAHSPVGARGLMQIMPGTGRQIARNLNERWRGNNSLYNPITNLKYGSFYYQKLLTQFDGNYAIALAAYNAGPQRVKKWLPETDSMPADIWIETIPYKETREYVSNVLAYALIYQQRVQSDDISITSLSMNDLTRDVTPLSTTP